MNPTPAPGPAGRRAAPPSRFLLAWRRPLLEAGLLAELELPNAVRATVTWSRHYPVTPDMASVPDTRGVYALFKHGKLFYYGSSKSDVRARMLKRVGEARQLGVDLKKALNGLTVRVGRVREAPGSQHGGNDAQLVKGVERVLIRHALKPRAARPARKLRNRDAFTDPFKVGAGGVLVRHRGESRGRGRGFKKAPRFLGTTTMKRKAGLVLERERDGWSGW